MSFLIINGFFNSPKRVFNVKPPLFSKMVNLFIVLAME